MATAPSSNDLTRQQLDELDALLQRMLSLPLGLPEGAVAVTAAVLNAPRPAAPELPLPEMPPQPLRPASPPVYGPAAISPPPPAFYQPPSLRDMPAAWREPLAPPVAQLLTMPAASEPTSAPDSRRSPRNTPEAARLLPPIEPAVVPPANATEPSPPAPAASPAPLRHEPISAAQKPFVLLNKALFFVLGRLGPPGRLLCSDFGQNLIGFAGIALIAYTGAKIVQLESWVSLPFDLPWPN